MNVYCKFCYAMHTVDEVESLNIKEDLRGCDILTFKCLATGVVETSQVFNRNSRDETLYD